MLRCVALMSRYARQNHKANLVIYSSAINHLASAGYIELVRRVYGWMIDDGIKPNNIVMSAMFKSLEGATRKNHVQRFNNMFGQVVSATSL